MSSSNKLTDIKKEYRGEATLVSEERLYRAVPGKGLKFRSIDIYYGGAE